MEQEFNEIIDEFIKINKKGYVNSINNNLNNSCGLTLEHLLGKKADNMFFPDFNGVEIKTTTRFSRYNISLFSMSFDGPNLLESNNFLKNKNMCFSIVKRNIYKLFKLIFTYEN